MSPFRFRRGSPRRIGALWIGVSLIPLASFPMTASVQAQNRIEKVPPGEPIPVDAIRGILDAFDRYPLVALSEAHGMKEEADFINNLIRHVDFPKTVNAIVLEAGNALHQGIIDAYVNGQAVPLDELRRVWRDHTCAALGPRDSSNIEEFFATVREVNGRLPPGSRIRVLAGDPPIDWAKVQTFDDVSPWLAQRDTHYAKIVEADVLANNLRALLIIGGAHLDRGPLPEKGEQAGVMLQIVERRHPGKTFVVFPHEGFGPQGGAWESKLSTWPRPSLAMIAGTWLALPYSSPRVVGRRTLEADQPPSLPRPRADALLYLGPRDALTMEELPADVYRDEAYLRELDRRSRICKGRPLDRSQLAVPRPKKWAEMFPVGDVILWKEE